LRRACARRGPNARPELACAGCSWARRSAVAPLLALALLSSINAWHGDTAASRLSFVRLLIIDDDRALRDALRRHCRWPTMTSTPPQVASKGWPASPSMPRTRSCSTSACRAWTGLRSAAGCGLVGDRVPVLMLTARDAVEDRIDGLDAGADDYLVKPFDVGELKARLRALLRRTTGDESTADTLAFHELRLDPSRHGVVVGDRFAELTRTEYQLLELLMRNPRQVLRHDMIYDRVWGYDFGPASNALRVYVGYLRRKLEQVGARPLIGTVRGVGYILREP